MMGSYGGGIGSLGWLGIGLFGLVLLGLSAWLVALLLPGIGGATRSTSGSAGTSGSADTTCVAAMDLLDRQLAGGHIDTADWQAQRAVLLAAREYRTRRRSGFPV